MDAVIGLSGVFLLIASIICLIVFGIILIVKAAKKRPKKAMAIATSISGGALVLGIILISAGVAMSPSDDSSSEAVAADSSSTESTADDSSSADSSSSSSTSSKSQVEKETKVNFSNTIGQQTTKVDSARIENVSSLSLTDDDGNDIEYALLIHMSITNNAQEEASSYPAQGHVVLSDGSQINGAEGLESDISNAFKGGDIANGATVKGYVNFPLSEDQAKNFKTGTFKFEVSCGDENMTEKNYNVPIKFNN